MANPENLKKGKATQFRTGEEQVRIAKKGGKASGIARNEKKLLRELLSEMLTDEQKRKMLNNLAKRAEKNDHSFEVLRDTLGEKPGSSVSIDGIGSVVIVDDCDQ